MSARDAILAREAAKRPALPPPPPEPEKPKKPKREPEPEPVEDIVTTDEAPE